MDTFTFTPKQKTKTLNLVETVDLRSATDDLPRSSHISDSNDVSDGNYFFTSDSFEELLLKIGNNPNHPRSREKRDVGILKSRDLSYIPLSHRGRATLRRLPIYDGIYINDFPCFPVELNRCKGSINKLCKRWYDSGTILVLIQRPSYREVFLGILYTQKKMPIIRSSKNKIRTVTYKMSKEDKESAKKLRKYSPCFWEFLHQHPEIEAQGIYADIATFVVSTATVGLTSYFGLSHPVSAIIFVSSLGGAFSSGMALGNSPAFKLLTMNSFRSIGSAASKLYAWVSGLWTRFDSACAGNLGTAWTGIHPSLRKIMTAVGSCAVVALAIGASVALKKMVGDVLRFTVYTDKEAVEAHSTNSTIETGAIAAILASFLLTTETTDSSKTFSLFNTMYRSLCIGAEIIDDIIPYKDWINRICEACGAPGPFKILGYRYDIQTLESKAATILDDPRFNTRVRTDKGLSNELNTLKIEARNLIDELRFNRNVSTDVKTQLVRTFNKICAAHTLCVKLNDRYCKRPLPVWLDVRGLPGQGKTEVANMVAKGVFKRLHGREMDHTDYFSKTPGSPYWAGYDSETVWCIFMDEFLTATMVSVNQPESSCMLNLIGTEYCPLDMADVESKGVTACRASMVVTTGNGDFTLTGLTNPDALRRRIAFPLTVTRRCELPDDASRADFNKSWSITVNQDYLDHPQSYKGMWREIDPSKRYTLCQIMDMVDKAVVEADTSISLYDRFVQAQAHMVPEADLAAWNDINLMSFDDSSEDPEPMGDQWHAIVITDDKNDRYLRYRDEIGDTYDYFIDSDSLVCIPSVPDTDIKSTEYYMTGWEALCDITSKFPCKITISQGRDDGISLYDGYHKKKLTVDYSPLGTNGFFTETDLYNLETFEEDQSFGPKIPCGQGKASLCAIYSRMVRDDMYLIRDTTRPNRFDIGRHKFDVLEERINKTSFPFIPYPIRANMHKYAVPISLGMGLFLGVIGLVKAVVSTYTGIDNLEVQSVQKHVVNKEPSVKMVEKVLPKYVAPVVIKAQGALQDSTSLVKNITGILCEGTGMRCWGIFIDAHTMITVGHVMRKRGNLRVYDTGQITYTTLASDEYSMERVEHSDLCFVFFKRPRLGVKNIIQRFCDSDIPTNATVRRMSITTVNTLGCAYTTECNTTVSVGVSYLVKNGVRIYPIDGFINVDDPTGKVGDCGLPYLRLENGAHRVTGMHFGGTGKSSCMHPLTRDMIKFYMSSNPFKELKMAESVIDVHCDDSATLKIKGGLISVSKLTCSPSFYPHGNTRVSSLGSLEGSFPPFPECVKDNAPATCHGPIAKLASDFSKRGQYNSSPIMDEVLGENLLRESYNFPEIMKHPWPHPNDYSYRDIILGVPGVMHGLSDSTSSGPLFKRGLYGLKPKVKKDLWNVEDRYLNPEFEKLIIDRIEKAEQGIITPMVVEGQYKDEVRDIKAKTVTVDGITGIKPREFYVACPLDIIETKTLLWPMLKVLHDSPVVSQCGINPWSVEWTMLIKDVKTRPNAMYVDVKSFDKTVDTYRFRDMLEECILEMYAQYNDEKLNNRIKVLMTKVFNYYYIHEDQLYCIIGPNPSGNILTVFDNCSRTWFCLKACFNYLRVRAGVGSEVTFEDNVTLKSNGDDCFVGVSDLVAPFFNSVTYAAVMFEFFGAIITDLDKVPFYNKDNANPFQPIETADFLSRGFELCEGGRYLAPLKLSSIWNSVYWSKTEPEDRYERVKHYEQIIDGCLRELALHPEETFNEFVNVVKPRFIHIGGNWKTDWNYEPYRNYMIHYSSCSDVTKVPTPYGCVQAQGIDETGIREEPLVPSMEPAFSRFPLPPRLHAVPVVATWRQLANMFLANTYVVAMLLLLFAVIDWSYDPKFYIIMMLIIFRVIPGTVRFVHVSTRVILYIKFHKILYSLFVLGYCLILAWNGGGICEFIAMALRDVVYTIVLICLQY